MEVNQLFHIPLTLLVGDKTISEEAFFADFKVVVVLAEPGGGKTSLMEHIARQKGTTATKASGFSPEPPTDCLIIDAIDEISRLAAHDISPLLKEIRSSKAGRVILASRSGEWEEADSQKVAAILGVEPRISHPLPLNEEEQKALFANELPDENFSAFCAQVHKLDLQYILGNP